MSVQEQVSIMHTAMRRYGGLVLAGLGTAGVAVLVSCGDSSNPGSGDNPAPTISSCHDVVLYQSAYSTRGLDTILASTPEKIDTIRTCSGSTFSQTPDTVEAKTDTTIYKFSGGALLSSANPLNQAFTSALAVFVPKANALRFYWSMNRIGSGSGITGTWWPESLVYEDPRDTLSLFEKALIDSFVEVYNDSIFDTTLSVAITSTKITMYQQWPAASEMLTQWAAESTGYAITVDSINDCEIQLTGQHSSEVVTITGNGDKNYLFGSTAAIHADYTYYATNPVSCPNPTRPTWWDEFKGGNQH
jgi:hypothetical protein